MAKKTKNHNKSPREIMEEMKKMQELKRKRAIVRDKFFPLLVDASESIEDAKAFVGSLTSFIYEKFLTRMKEVKFKDLDLEAKLDKENKQYENIKKILDLLGEETAFTARELVEGMKGEIEFCINEEMKGRKLNTLKTNFYQE